MMHGEQKKEKSKIWKEDSKIYLEVDYCDVLLLLSPIQASPHTLRITNPAPNPVPVLCM